MMSSTADFQNVLLKKVLTNKVRTHLVLCATETTTPIKGVSLRGGHKKERVYAHVHPGIELGPDLKTLKTYLKGQTISTLEDLTRIVAEAEKLTGFTAFLNPNTVLPPGSLRSKELWAEPLKFTDIKKTFDPLFPMPLGTL